MGKIILFAPCPTREQRLKRQNKKNLRGKKFANEQLSNWNIFLSHCLKRVGDKFMLFCDFDIKTLWNALISRGKSRNIINWTTFQCRQIISSLEKDDFLLLNHIIMVVKQYIYFCRNNSLIPSFNILLSTINSVHDYDWL